MAKKEVKKSDPEKGAHVRVLIIAVLLSCLFSLAFFLNFYSGIKLALSISNDLNNKMMESDFRYQCQLLHDIYNCDESAIYKLKTTYYYSYSNDYLVLNFKELCRINQGNPLLDVEGCINLCPQCNPDLLKEDPCQTDEECTWLNPAWYCDQNIGFCRS